MAENEGSDSKFMTGFLVGFLVGVLVALGAGGSLVIVYGRQESLRAREAMMRAMEAEEVARLEMMRAEQERARAEQALKEAKGKEK